MNKPIIISLLLLACHLPGFAGPVTPDRAQRVAESFFAAQPRTRASGSDPVRLAWKLSGEQGEADLLYAFDCGSSGGYVIVAGEDAATPVLGFSLSGSFPAQDMPEPMRDLLDYYGNVLRLAREKKWAAAKAENDFDPSHIVKLETARWAQGNPYNRYCPVRNGIRCVTGCVATAIGIIMNYHRWPERGTGELPSYTYRSNGMEFTVEGHSLGHRYDWEAMNRAEDRDDDQIARLLYDVGVMVEMSYAPYASAAGTSYVKRLSQYFSYDKDIRQCDRRIFSDAQWEQTIRNEIDASRPVLYEGFAPGVGHAMVIDGYSDRYFSINLGWGPGPDQWLLLTPVEGHEKELIYYYNLQCAFSNIKPDEDGEPDWLATVNAIGNVGLPYDFSVGQEFVLTQFFHANQDVQCEYDLFDQAGNFKERISEPFELKGDNDDNYSFKKVSCTINVQPRQGDWFAPVLVSDGKRTISRHGRLEEFRFQDLSPDKDIRVGFVTEEETEDFLSNAIRNSRNSSLKSLKDYLYFVCYKDFTWILLKKENDSETRIWGSEDGIIYWPQESFEVHGNEQYRCTSRYREDACYLLVHLDPGDYVLRVRNPLTGESVSIDLTI